MAALPHLLEDVKRGKHSPNVIRAYIFERLIGGTMKVQKCGSCGNKFYSYEPAGTMGYYCPVCSTSIGITVDKDEIEILKVALAGTEPNSIIPFVNIVQHKKSTAMDGSADKVADNN